MACAKEARRVSAGAYVAIAGAYVAIIGALAVLALVAVAWWRRKPVDYDVVVIGGGAAGLTAAGMAARLGARTLLVERDRLGGDCTWRGCVPSKALLAAAATAQSARDAARYGLGPAELEIDLRRVMAHVRAIQERIYEEADSPEALSVHGVEVRRATARFVAPHRIELGGDAPVTIRFRWAFICTGTRPVAPALQNLSSIQYLTSDTLFELDELPQHLIVLGGGPVGVEMAQAFRRLGARVTIVERGEHLLPHDDPTLVRVLEERLREEGVELALGAEVETVRRDGSGVRLRLRGQAQEICGDRLLVAVGRTPNTADLGLDSAGIAHNRDGVGIDRRCRTNRRHIYACGDVAHRLKFTHVAEHMAKVAVSHALLGVPSKVAEAVPWVTFTDPEVAHVGATRSELDAKGKAYRTYRFPYAKLDRALAHSRPEGAIVVHASRWSGRILGASAVGTAAGEIIGELGLALATGLSLRKIADSLHAYPTFVLGARRVSDQWYIQHTPRRLLGVLARLRGLQGTLPPAPDDHTIV
jgi:pyruvate/2-oxoglutarate dehydrogenase complex dihydrolipoamide dehydrogenase (E3) component